MNTTLPEDVTTNLLAIGATGWIADLSDGRPNDRARVSMYLRFVDAMERGEREHHGARRDLLAAYAAARVSLWGMMVAAAVLAERERCLMAVADVLSDATSIDGCGPERLYALVKAAIRSGEG